MLQEEQQGRTYFLIGLVVLIVVILVTFTRPAITGYSIYNKIKDSNVSLEDYGKDINDLEDKMIRSQTNLSTCYDFNARLLDKVDSSSLKLQECNSSLTECSMKVPLLQDQINMCELACNDEVFSLEKDVNDLQKKLDQLAENAANNICCKKRIDNRNIGYYRVEADSVVCMEEPGIALSCT